MGFIISKYYYLFNDSISNKSFGFDIRSLLAILKSDYPSCPYTFRNYTDYEKNSIWNHAKILSRNGVILEFDKLELNKEQEMEMRMKDVFHKINMLDNYSSHLWFKNMDLKEKLVSSFLAFENKGGLDLDSKVHSIRLNAIQNFENKGFPTKKDEEWIKFNDLSEEETAEPEEEVLN